MTDLVEFLRARLDEDEEVAQRVEPEQSSSELHAAVVRDGGQPFLVIASERVRRDIEGKRRIIAESPASGVLRDELVGAYADLVLAYLALPYADHPDYREEWKP